MNTNIAFLNAYDWTDAWLIKIVHTAGGLNFTVDVRDLQATSKRGEREYRIIDIKMEDIFILDLKFARKIIPDEDEIASIETLVVEESAGFFELKVGLDYGSINAKSGSLKIDVVG